MIYGLIKIYARLVIRIYCPVISINKPETLHSKGPLLLAANHPNSFLDGMILTTLFDQPVYSLARGDVFKKKWLDKLLRKIQLLPVYRTSEGVQNLENNYTTFAACQQSFEQKNIVLIFSEGRCENEWHLRPLKKGTARLAVNAWKEAIPLQVIPTALNYSSFKKFGKEVHVFFGDPITVASIPSGESEGRQLLIFNEILEDQLQEMVYEIDPNDHKKIRTLFPSRKNFLFYFLFIPAIIGWILHAPLFYPCKIFTHARFRNSGHYDSMLTSLLIIFYPFYWLIFFILAYSIQPLYGWLTFLLLPLTAWACSFVKLRLGI